MDKVKIKRVKRSKKKTTTKEKVLAGLGLGSTLLGGIGAISAQPKTSQFTRTQTNEEGSVSAKAKGALKKIFGASQAKAETIDEWKAQAMADLEAGYFGEPGSEGYNARLDAINQAYAEATGVTAPGSGTTTTNAPQEGDTKVENDLNKTFHNGEWVVDAGQSVLNPNSFYYTSDGSNGWILNDGQTKTENGHTYLVINHEWVDQGEAVDPNAPKEGDTRVNNDLNETYHSGQWVLDAGQRVQNPNTFWYLSDGQNGWILEDGQTKIESGHTYLVINHEWSDQGEVVDPNAPAEGKTRVNNDLNEIYHNGQWVVDAGQSVLNPNGFYYTSDGDNGWILDNDQTKVEDGHNWLVVNHNWTDQGPAETVTPPPVIPIDSPPAVDNTAYDVYLTDAGRFVYVAGFGNIIVKADGSVVDGNDPSKVVTGVPQSTVDAILKANAVDTQTKVAPLPNIVVPVTAPGNVGTAVTIPLSIPGITGQLTWSVVNGSLPPGLTLDPNTGVISGTPKTQSMYQFTVQAKDAQGNIYTTGDYYWSVLGAKTNAPADPAKITPTITSNISNPKVGDAWTVTVTGVKGQPVYASKPDGSDRTLMGYIGEEGKLVVTGKFTAGQVGAWNEVWTVGADPATATVAGNLNFVIKATAIPGQGTPYDLSKGFVAPAYVPSAGINVHPDFNDTAAVMRYVNDVSGYQGYVNQLLDDYYYMNAYNGWLNQNARNLELGLPAIPPPVKPAGFDDRQAGKATTVYSGNLVTGMGTTSPLGTAPGGRVVTSPVIPNAPAPGVPVTGAVVVAPTLTSISPGTLPSTGGAVTISGANFNAIAANNLVEFENTATHSIFGLGVASGTATSLRLNVPALSAGTYKVRVRNGSDPLKVSNELTLVVTAATTVNVPVISGLTPSSAALGQSLNVTLTGTNLTGAVLSFPSGSGITISNSQVNAAGTQITATFAVASTATAGAKNLVITTSQGAASATFTVTSPGSIGSELTLSAGTVSIIAGQSTTVNASVRIEDAVTYRVTAVSSNASVATVLVNTSTGIITITGITAGTATVTVHPIDLGTNTSKDKTITVNVAAPSGGGGSYWSAPAFVTSGLPQGAVGQPYNTYIQAAGNSSLTFRLAGNVLPPGLYLNANGVISGVPTVVGTYTFTVQATDTQGYTTARQFTIIIGGQNYGGNGYGGGYYNAGGQVNGASTFQGLQMPAGYPASSGGFQGLQMPPGYSASEGYVAGAVQETLGTYKVKKGDTLWGIAKKHYGDGRMWRKVLEANPNCLSRPGNVRTLKIGAELVIPKI